MSPTPIGTDRRPAPADGDHRSAPGRAGWIPLVAAVLALTALAGCASKGVMLEVSGSILYDKPQIQAVSHRLDDDRRAGGDAVVTIAMTGDPGLEASFDIHPAVASRQPMSEVEPGRYAGRFVFPREASGGPFTIIGRLKHDQAGEVARRDPNPIILALPERGR